MPNLPESDSESVHSKSLSNNDPNRDGGGEEVRSAIGKPSLTIGFATRNEYPGAWMTLNALLTYHRELLSECNAEILIVDNSDKQAHADNLERHLKIQLNGEIRDLVNVTYIRESGTESSCLWKQRGIERARGEIVIWCDGHVLFPVESLRSVVEYFQANPDSNDLVMGPCYSRSDVCIGARQLLYETETDHGGNPFKIPSDAHVYNGVVCRGNQLGVWCRDPRADDPNGPAFEIMAQGTGAFAFRKKAWPGWNPNFIGFGGNETYIFEKFRARGDRVLCLPGFRWIHQFGKPDGNPYNLSAGSEGNPPSYAKIRNYLLGFKELGRRELYDAVVQHFSHPLNTHRCPKAVAKAMQDVPWH